MALALGACYVEPDDKNVTIKLDSMTGGKVPEFSQQNIVMREFSDPPQGEINDYGIRPLRTFQIKGIRVGGLLQ